MSKDCLISLLAKSIKAVFLDLTLGAEEIRNRTWKVFYRNVLLGYFNEKDIFEKAAINSKENACQKK